jgi:hypothetical protein
MRRAIKLVAFAALAACGGGGDDDSATDGDGDRDGGLGPIGDGGGYPGDGDDLEVASGCGGVFNPDQILEYHFDVPGWSTVQNDCTYEQYVEADMRCGDGPPIRVGMRHKRSGGTDKPGFKIDVNHLVAGQEFFSLKKLSFENGISSSQECGGDDGDGGGGALMSEYLAWRVHVLGGHVTGRAVFARVYVNGDYIGVYVNVEQPDKVFLEKRLGDDSGWLWKQSGGVSDGLKTNEGTTDPYDAYFCFFSKNPGGGCAQPDEAELAEKLDVQQLLKVGAANALIANHDAIMLKLNNYYYYDYDSGPRMYFPWDLDSTMKDDYDVFTGTVAGGTTVFTDVLFPTWEDDYDAILTGWLAGPLSLAAIEAEIDRAAEVAGDAMADDPLAGGAAAAADDLRAWWTNRHAQVSASVADH